MPRYIDAEPYEGMQIGKVIDVTIKASKNIAFGDIHGQDFVKVVQIDDIPTADVQEVKHGKWICMSDADGYYYCCSVCGENLERIPTSPCTAENLYPDLVSCSKTRFCPDCGAKMDGRIF